MKNPTHNNYSSKSTSTHTLVWVVSFFDLIQFDIIFQSWPCSDFHLVLPIIELSWHTQEYKNILCRINTVSAYASNSKIDEIPRHLEWCLNLLNKLNSCSFERLRIPGQMNSEEEFKLARHIKFQIIFYFTFFFNVKNSSWTLENPGWSNSFTFHDFSLVFFKKCSLALIRYFQFTFIKIHLKIIKSREI